MALSGRCRYHPERDAIGVCMRCRAVICSECSTRIDGINHCRPCLEVLRGEVGARRAGPSFAGRGVAIAILFGLCFVLVLLLSYAAGRPS